MDYKNELAELVNILLRENGSDLHLAEERHPIIRVAGLLIPLVKKPKLTKHDLEGFLDEMLNADNKKLFAALNEVDFSHNVRDIGRFRGNVYLRKGFISIALRLIPRNISTLEQLNLPKILADFTRRKQGFFLVVGRVGQGKTTTLASMIELINRERAEHIITIEDPIEYIFEEKKSIIDQREIRVDTKDFKTALLNMFRQDINVAMIGEMRGIETIATAVTAAETGHLVFSTLHTNNAAQTIDRIIDSFPADQQDQIKLQLGSSLLGIFSQRLIPKVSGGLVPAYELLIANPAVANLIREGRTHEIGTVIETGLDQGMIDFNRCLVDLVRDGQVTIENAYQYSLNPKALEKLL